MPKLAELREIDGQIWARIEMPSDEGAVTIWTHEEARTEKRSSYKRGYEDAKAGEPFDEFHP